MTATITEIETTTIEHLDESRTCDNRTGGPDGGRCVREAKWIIFWKPLPCGCPADPTLACEPCREMLLSFLASARCDDCDEVFWPAEDLVVRIEAL